MHEKKWSLRQEGKVQQRILSAQSGWIRTCTGTGTFSGYGSLFLASYFKRKSWTQLCKCFKLLSLSLNIPLKTVGFLSGWGCCTYLCFQAFCTTDLFVLHFSHFSNTHCCRYVFDSSLRGAHTFCLHTLIFPGNFYLFSRFASHKYSKTDPPLFFLKSCYSQLVHYFCSHSSICHDFLWKSNLTGGWPLSSHSLTQWNGSVLLSECNRLLLSVWIHRCPSQLKKSRVRRQRGPVLSIHLGGALISQKADSGSVCD